jgi:hypothetical protein
MRVHIEHKCANLDLEVATAADAGHAGQRLHYLADLTPPQTWARPHLLSEPGHGWQPISGKSV